MEKTFALMAILYEHFQTGRIAYNQGDLELAKQEYNLILGMFAIYDDDLSTIPEAKMLYRESVQMLGDIYLALRDYTSYQACLGLFLDVSF